jgi:hypothetical protein
MNLKLALGAALLTLGLATPSIAAPFGNGPFGNGLMGQPAAYGSYHPAKPAQWELVGQRSVNFRLAHDTIPAFGRERYSQVMLCVYNQAVRISDFDVKFANGGSQDVAVRNVIGAGQCTRAIDLKGNQRDIKAVTLAAQKIGFIPFGRPALVKVFAR